MTACGNGDLSPQHARASPQTPTRNSGLPEEGPPWGAGTCGKASRSLEPRAPRRCGGDATRSRERCRMLLGPASRRDQCFLAYGRPTGTLLKPWHPTRPPLPLRPPDQRRKPAVPSRGTGQGREPMMPPRGESPFACGGQQVSRRGPCLCTDLTLTGCVAPNKCPIVSGPLTVAAPLPRWLA